jgi:hypothetical protein
MRHLSRVHGISIGFLHEQYDNKNMNMQYVSSSLMAADIYTKTFHDSAKWAQLCAQVQVFTAEQIEGGDLTTCYEVLKSGGASRCIQQPDRMPLELKDLDSGLGWHRKDENMHYYIVREPKQYRVHQCGDFVLRTTWIKASDSWNKIEDRVEWQNMNNPRQKISDDWIEKAIFVFENKAEQSLMATVKIKRSMNSKPKTKSLEFNNANACDIDYNLTWEFLHRFLDKGLLLVDERGGDVGLQAKFFCSMVIRSLKDSGVDGFSDDKFVALEAVAFGRIGVTSRLIGNLCVLLRNDRCTICSRVIRSLGF